MPYVAEIEQAVGLGRDARRKAFEALMVAGIIHWKVERRGGVIVGKTLRLHADRVRAPENQADGKSAPESHRAPENPADGKSTPAEVETRPCIDGFSGDTLKGKKRKSAAHARRAVGSPARGRSPLVSGGRELPKAGELTAFQRARVTAGQSVVIDGRSYGEGSAELAELARAVRFEAEKRAIR